MAHEVLFSANYNGFIRSIRSFLKDAPRVVRADHKDINNLGVSYSLASTSARPSGDILHIAPETDALLGDYRATCVVAGGVNSYGAEVTPTVTFNTGARTIIRTAGSWVTDGFVAGNLIRIRDAATAGNNGVFRIASITTTSIANDTITLNTADTLAASDAADVITANPLGGGAIFDVRYDPSSANTHLGWMASEQEFMAKDGTIWLYMRNGGSWAVGDFSDFELELGNFSLSEDRAINAVVTFNENTPSADTITRNDYNGNFIRDGFVAGGAVEVLGSASNNGRYLIATVTATAITLDSGADLADEGPVEVTLVPRFQVSVDFASGPRTITRASGSWLTDGFLPGGRIEIQDAVDAGNNGLFLIDTVTATVITLDSSETLAAETGDTIHATPRNVNLRAWGEHRYVWSATSGTTGTDSLASGELPPVPDANGNYTSEWVGIGPGNDPINNPQTIYIGLQTQFSGTTRQNVELRAFDIVSDSPFGGLGNASPPTYIYLNLSPSMETYMRADGEMVAGFLDVNTSVTEWFYMGFIDVHATSVAHPRPIFVGGAGYEPTDTRASSGLRLEFFPSPSIENLGSDPKRGSAFFRWVDGTWVNVGNNGVGSGSTESALTDSTFRAFTWPYRNETFSAPFWFGANGASITPVFGVMTIDTLNGDFSGSGIQVNGSQLATFVAGMRPTPTTVTPVPNQRFGLLPVVLIVRNPSQAIVGDLRSIFHVSGSGQATKNRILEQGRVYVVGQNHEKTNVQDFAAIELN